MHSPQRTHPADAGEYRVLPTDSAAPTATAGQGFPVGRRRPCRRKARPEPGLLWEAQFLLFGIEVISDPEAVRNGVGISVWPRLERRHAAAQIRQAGTTAVIRHIPAQPRHSASTGMRSGLQPDSNERDIQRAGGLSDRLGPVVGRATGAAPPASVPAACRQRATSSTCMALGSQPLYVGQPIPKTTPLKPDAV